jgi:hypothetical protein
VRDIAGGRLNLAIPVDDQDSIKQAGAEAAFRQMRKLLRDVAKKSKTSGVNQTVDTTGRPQSKRFSPRPRNGRGVGGEG